MKSSDPRPQGSPSRPGRPLQPRDSTIEESDGEPFHADLLTELTQSEDPVRAERLERILADADVILRLQLSGFDTSSDDWKELARALAEYGYGVFVGWCHAGALRRVAAAHGQQGVHGLSRIPEGLRLVGDDAHELAAELMIQSIDAFRTKTLMSRNPSRRWHPEGGASLRTFFIGRCLMELPDVYERWARPRERSRLEVPHTTGDHDNAGAESTDPESAALAAVGVLELTRVDPLGVEMFKLHAEGYTYAEIAEMLTDMGTPSTEAAVRSRMARLRKQALAPRVHQP